MFNTADPSQFPSDHKEIFMPERLDYLWFLGYGLDDSTPNCSVLSKASRRWAADVFECLFVRSVSQSVFWDEAC